MQRKIAFVFTATEAEEILQDALDNNGLRLSVYDEYYPQALSDTQALDAGQIDGVMARYLEIPQCESWMVDGDLIVLADQNDV